MLVIKTKSQSLKDFIYLFMFAAIIKLNKYCVAFICYYKLSFGYYYYK